MAFPTQGLYPGQIWDCEEIEDDTETSRPGAALQITASVAGTVTLTLGSGAEIIVTVAVGDTIVPYQVTKAAQGTATVQKYYNLFPTP